MANKKEKGAKKTDSFEKKVEKESQVEQKKSSFTTKLIILLLVLIIIFVGIVYGYKSRVVPLLNSLIDSNAEISKVINNVSDILPNLFDNQAQVLVDSESQTEDEPTILSQSEGDQDVLDDTIETPETPETPETNDLEQEQEASNQEIVDLNYILDRYEQRIASLELELTDLRQEQRLEQNNLYQILDKIEQRQEDYLQAGNQKLLEQITIFRKMAELEVLIKYGEPINQHLEFLSKYINFEPQELSILSQKALTNRDLSKKLDDSLPRALAYEKTRSSDDSKNTLLYPYYTTIYSVFRITSKDHKLAGIALDQYLLAIESSEHIMSLGGQVAQANLNPGHPLTEWLKDYYVRLEIEEGINKIWQEVFNQDN